MLTGNRQLGAAILPIQEVLRRNAECVITHCCWCEKWRYRELLGTVWKKKRMKKTTTFGISLMSSQVLYQAAQVGLSAPRGGGGGGRNMFAMQTKQMSSLPANY